MKRRALNTGSLPGVPRTTSKSLSGISFSGFSFSGFSFSGFSFSGISFSGIKREQSQSTFQPGPTDTEQTQQSYASPDKLEKLPVPVPQRSDTPTPDKLEKLPVLVPQRTDHLN